MTAEQLHDAIGLLPGDLLEKTDRLRQNPVKKKTNVTRYLSAAACAAVVLGGALLFRAVGQQKGAAFSAAAPVMDAAQMDEAPAEQAPMLQSAQLPADAGAGSAADRSAAVENGSWWPEGLPGQRWRLRHLSQTRWCQCPGLAESGGPPGNR